MKKKLLLLTFVLFAIITIAKAQTTKSITGTVTDSKNETLIGVSVSVEGTQIGTVTDINGKYRIEVPQLSTSITFTYIGFTKKVVNIGEKLEVNVIMTESESILDEVVVVGFGAQKRRDIVGSIVSVSAKDIKNSGQSNALQALQGSVPGLRVDNAAVPGASPTLRIRGLKTLKSTNNSPLYIVDGIPFTDMRSISPDDIESMEVLKDASASAIYGSQAANGVILISTKKSQGGKPRVSASFTYAMQNLQKDPRLMNGKQYLAFKQEAARAKGVASGPQDVLTNAEYQLYSANTEVDPYDMMIHNNAPLYEASVSVSGGDKVRYYVGANYSDQDGLVKETFFKRASIRSNLSIDLLPNLKLTNNTNIYQYDTNTANTGDYGLSAMYRLSPYSEMYNENGAYAINPMADDALFGNPLQDAYDVTKKDVSKGVNNTTILSWNVPFVQGLQIEGKYSIDQTNWRFGSFAPSTTKEGESGKGKATRADSETSKWYTEGLASYKRTLGGHNLDLTGMLSAESSTYQRQSVTGTNYPTSAYLWYNIGAANNPLSATSDYNRKRLIGMMFRANYNYLSRYYLTFTVRRDGFSGFSENRKYATFPSAALAWRINDEAFMKNLIFIDNLKLRLSYGKTGNQGVDAYGTLANLTSKGSHVFDKQIVSGHYLTSLATDLKWETTTSFNIGLDYSLFNGRLIGALDLYNAVSDDLLMERSIPIMMGVGQMMVNMGKVQNRGIEVELTGVPIRTNDWEWSIGGNISYNKNEIKELYGSKTDDIANNWFIGKPLGVIYTQKSLGLWQESEASEAAKYGALPGMPKLEDINGPNGVPDDAITAQDRQIIGKTVPPVILGLRTTLSYKGFTLSVVANGAFGHKKNVTHKFLDNGRFRNFNFDYWTPETPNKKFPRPGTVSGDQSDKLGSVFTYSADWFKIKNISLSYKVPSQLIRKLGMESLSLYTGLQDYFNFYSFPFVDPETGNGIGSYPANKQWKMGIQMTF